MHSKQDIENAARLVRGEFEWYCRGANNPNGEPNVPCIDGAEWRPDADDTDSRRLEIVCLNWMAERGLKYMAGIQRLSEARAALGRLRRESGGDITPESYRAAVLDLAAAIGAHMKGGGR